ncbi:YdcF family protein [Zhengella mangrovi]|nr:YdcF family protein [Zhengella mangrovi]
MNANANDDCAGAAMPAAMAEKTEGPTVIRRLRRAWRYTFLGILVIAAVFVAGFTFFADSVSRMAPPGAIADADAIIVLTGGYHRLDTAIDLLENGHGKRLLISGVNPVTTRTSLRKATGARSALFNCCIDIDIEALDTIGNATESAKWLKRNGYRSVILVTNNYHMPRSMMELKRTAGDIAITPWPVVNTPMDDGRWMVKPAALRVLLTEYTKYVAAMARGVFPGDQESESLRASVH